MAPGMVYIWKHGASDIHMPAPVETKRKMENWRKKSGYAKRCHEEARYQVGASQGGVSENMEQLTRQVSSVEKHGSE